MACNCPVGSCSCGCQSNDPCSIPSCTTSCSAGEPCAQIESSCETEQQECATNGNLFVEVVAAGNMPACDGIGSLFVDDASRLFPGAVIYAEGVGYLTVVTVVDASEVTVRNDCPECALHVLDPGAVIPVGTQFGVGIPFCATEGVEFTGPMLNSDFFIPAVAACVLIAVTSIDGLAIGDTVSIAGNRYRINDIPTTTTMEICNDGEGGTPGTLVEKDPNGDGVLDYPILRISGVNPCAEDPVDAGRILVCSTGSTQRALEGSIENQVPAWNESTNRFELRVVDSLATCVTLVCCLTLDPEAEECAPYLIDVLPNTTKFSEELSALSPNPLQITIDGDPFCVTAVIDENTLRVIPSFEVLEVTEYEEGAVICIADCCVQCTPDIYTMDDSFMSNNCTPEILLSTGAVPLIAPAGVETFTIPASLAENNETGFEPDAAYLWELLFENASCCGCRQYYEIISNFEIGHSNNDPDLFTNVELRILKTEPIANSQAFAGIPFVSPRALIVGAQATDLIPGFQTINTYKGAVSDRGFLNPGETGRFVGHVRMVTENVSVGDIGFTITVNWRIWIKAWNFDCANVTVDIP